MTVKEQILTYIEKNQPVSPKIILENVEIGEQMLYRHLKKLVEENKIEKIGSSPKVFYRTKSNSQIMLSAILAKDIVDVLETHFYHITPSGKELIGKEGFISWCLARNFDLQKKSQEFLGIIKKYQNLRKNDLLDATAKLKSTFPKGADELYYYDFYSIEIFGKTKLGQKLLYAKQSENRKLMKELSIAIKPALDNLIKRKSIDAVAYVQPTVPRKVQFMKVLEKELSLSIPIIHITKVSNDIRVPQKTLRKLADRIENANETFVVESNTSFKKVLLIDDAVGSGASINQIALKIKNKGLAKQVIGFAITGSLNDFDIISEA